MKNNENISKNKFFNKKINFFWKKSVFNENTDFRAYRRPAGRPACRPALLNFFVKKQLINELIC